MATGSAIFCSAVSLCHLDSRDILDAGYAFSHVSCKFREELAMALFSLLALVALSLLAARGAESVKRKLLHILVVFSFMGWGLGIGWALSLGDSDLIIGAEGATPLAILLGAVGALACFRRNERCARKDLATIITV